MKTILAGSMGLTAYRSGGCRMIIPCLAFVVLVFQTTMAEAAQWWLQTVDGRPAAAEASLELGANGELSGLAGCNRFNGTVRSQNGDLVVDGPLAATAMACPDNAVAEQEFAILSLFSGVISTDFDPVIHSLTLSANGVSAVYADRADEIDAPEDGNSKSDASLPDHVVVVGVDSALNIRAASSTSSAVVSRARVGSLFASDGCNTAEGRVWCHVRALDTTGMRGWAAAEYLAPATAARRAASGVFDGIGRLACTGSGTADADICDYGLTRDTDETVSIVVYVPDGAIRQFDAIEGVFTVAGEVGVRFSQQDESGARILQVGEERYELPGDIFGE